MNSLMFATLTACLSRSMSGCSVPTAMLFAMVSENMNPSCITAPLLALHRCGFIIPSGVSPSLMLPLPGV